jgi:hypothetical protein
VLRKTRFLIRKQVFKEMCGKDDSEALRYLQTSVEPIVNHQDETEESEFRDMARWLFDVQTQGLCFCGGWTNVCDRCLFSSNAVV